MTHDYIRNGTTTLFAALNVLEGKVIGRCMQRHRHQEFHPASSMPSKRTFPPARSSTSSSTTTPLTSIPRSRPGWLATRASPSTSPRPPAPGSMPSKASSQSSPGAGSKRGVFRSHRRPPGRYQPVHRPANDDPKPFVWTADPDKIVAAVHRGHQGLDSIH